MLIIDTLIILGFYSGFRLREHYKNKKESIKIPNDANLSAIFIAINGTVIGLLRQ